MTHTTAPAATDADLAAAIGRGIAAGSLVVVDDAYLATLAAQIDADDAPAAAAGMLDLDADTVGMLF